VSWSSFCRVRGFSSADSSFHSEDRPPATRAQSSSAARRWITSCVEGRRPWTWCAACSMPAAAASYDHDSCFEHPLLRYPSFIAAKYSPHYESVLTRIADDEDLQLIFELDNATNARLRAEERPEP